MRVYIGDFPIYEMWTLGMLVSSDLVCFPLDFAWDCPVICDVHTGVGSFLAMNLHETAA